MLSLTFDESIGNGLFKFVLLVESGVFPFTFSTDDGAFVASVVLELLQACIIVIAIKNTKSFFISFV